MLNATPSSPAQRLAILADDLTGACDSAAPFALRGFPTEVGVAPGAQPSAACQVWSISSESRHVEPAILEAHLATHLGTLPTAKSLFKKIDSVFRGNTFAEIRTMVARHNGSPVLLAPAFPHLGRTLRAGVLHICDASGASTLSIFESLRAHRLDVALVPSGCAPLQLRDLLQDHARRKTPLLLCDAETQRDLDDLAVAAQSYPSPLWIGSAGLAHALAASWKGLQSWSRVAPPRIIKPDAPLLLFFIGSTHPVTRAQVGALNGVAASPDHVRVIAVPYEAQPQNAASHHAVHAAVRDLTPAQVGCLFVTGGDTASVVFAALGITALRVVDEFAPGLPLAVAIGGSWEGTPVLLKSGGFGSSTVLCEIATRFGALAPAIAGEGSAR